MTCMGWNTFVGQFGVTCAVHSSLQVRPRFSSSLVRAEPRGFNEPPDAVPLATARGRLRRGSSARDGAAGAGTGCGGSAAAPRLQGRLLPGPGPLCGRPGGPAVPLASAGPSRGFVVPVSKRAAVEAEAAPGTRTGSYSPVGETVKPGPGSDGRAGASGGVGGPGGRRPCPVRDTRTDGGAPARPGAARGGCGAPGRSRAACAEADAAACPAPAWGQPGLCPPRDTGGTALLQPSCGSRSSSWTAPVQFWLQLLFVVALVSSPAYGRLRLVSAPVCGRLQLVCSFRSSSWMAPLQFWLQLVSSSSAASSPADAQFQFGRSSSLSSSSSSSPAPADAQFQFGRSSSSWMVPASAPPRVHLQLQLMLSSSLAASPAHGWFQPQLLLNSSPAQ
ncbi:uncharacterized protein [Nyctibius grandis]|uniref:uncharacterized protein n=1 Tax=Nyctibius grandis TaxID=48427 RepID=UPI0035BBAEAE